MHSDVVQSSDVSVFWDNRRDTELFSRSISSDNIFGTDVKLSSIPITIGVVSVILFLMYYIYCRTRKSHSG